MMPSSGSIAGCCWRRCGGCRRLLPVMTAPSRLRPIMARRCWRAPLHWLRWARWMTRWRPATVTIAVRPRLAEAFNLRGSLLWRMGRADAALDGFNAALSLAPNHAEFLNNRGLALAALGRGQDALESYDAALAVQPRHAEAWTNRGNALAGLQRFEEALESHDRALQLSRAMPRRWTTKARRWWRCKNSTMRSKPMTCAGGAAGQRQGPLQSRRGAGAYATLSRRRWRNSRRFLRPIRAILLR